MNIRSAILIAPKVDLSANLLSQAQCHPFSRDLNGFLQNE
jgi:hypothetical protein